MAETFSKKSLQEAAGLVADSMLQAIPAPSACTHDFSPEFEARMAPLCRKGQRKEHRHRIWQQAAIVALASLLAVSTWLSVDAQAREKAFAWIREEIQGSNIYRFFGGDSEKLLPDYEVTWLPEGFEVVEQERNKSWDLVFYTNPTTGKSVVITCYRLADAQALTLAGEGSEMENKEMVYINGVEGDYYPDPSDVPTNVLLWVNEEYSALLTIDSDLNKDVMLHIAEGIVLSDSTK